MGLMNSQNAELVLNTCLKTKAILRMTGHWAFHRFQCHPRPPSHSYSSGEELPAGTPVNHFMRQVSVTKGRTAVWQVLAGVSWGKRESLTERTRQGHGYNPRHPRPQGDGQGLVLVEYLDPTNTELILSQLSLRPPLHSFKTHINQHQGSVSHHVNLVI